MTTTPVPPKTDLDKALDHLKRWSNQVHCADDAAVRSLLTVANDSNAALHWSRTDLLGALPDPTSKAGGGLGMVGRAVLIARNISVFAPIALTWWAISEVAEAYSEVDAATASEVPSFVAFWQSGGAGGSEFLTLAGTAIVAFALVAAVAALTLIGEVLQSAGRSRRSRTIDRLESERAEVAVNLAVALAPRVSVTQDSVVDIVSIALGRVGELLESAINAGELVTAAADSITGYASALSTVADDLDDVQRAIAALTQEVAALGEETRSNRAELTPVFDALRDTRRILGEAMTALAETTDTVREDLDALHASQGFIRGS